MAVGALGAAAAFPIGGVKQFAFSWLLAFMFSLSLCLGAWFLVMVHHLFDASWSVPTRRFCEHLACLLGPTMLLLFLPIALTAKQIYPWMTLAHPDHAVQAKYPLFTMPGYYVSALVLFADLVALLQSPPLLVPAPGRNRLGPLHPSHALLRRLGRRPLRLHRHAGGHCLDEGLDG